MNPTRTLAVVLGASLLWLAGSVAMPKPLVAATLDVEVTADQRVTVSGSSDSLRSVIEEICRQGEVEIRNYGAPDRPFLASYEKLPLAEVFSRLLRSENYMVGLRGGGDAEPRISWLNVVGADGEAAASAAGTVDPSRANPGAPGPPPAFIVNAFASIVPGARKEAIRNAKAMLESDSEERRAFIRSDAAEIAKRVADYPSPRAVIVELQAGSYEYVVRRKLGMLMNELNARLKEKGK